MYTRYGHVNQVFVKVGDKVKLGQKIATNGTGNGQWQAHLHRDHPVIIPGGNYAFYNIGWTLSRTKEMFADPARYPKALGKEYDHEGLGYLQFWDYATNTNNVTFAKAKSPCYHPGLDENGKGSGNSDYDDPIYCVAEGTVVYVANDRNASNGGWGKLIVIREEKLDEVKSNDDSMKATKKLSDLYLSVTGRDSQQVLDEGEQDKLAETVNAVFADLRGRIQELITENNGRNARVSELEEKVSNQASQITTLQEKLSKEKEAHNKTQEVLVDGSSVVKLLQVLKGLIIKR